MKNYISSNILGKNESIFDKGKNSSFTVKLQN